MSAGRRGSSAPARMGLRQIVPASLLLLLSSSVSTIQASQCAAFDIDNNAYLFSQTYGDYSLGTNISNTAAWTSLTNATGRPDFSGNYTQCFTNQFTNGLYVLGASAANPTDAYIFDFASQTWSTQATSGGPSSDYVAILDHDTVVLYAFANGSMDALSFSTSGAKATSETLAWQIGAQANSVPFATTDYQPVLGAANNHIQFLNVPGTSPGQAYIFVIHYAHYQPEVQSFGTFPVADGQTVTIFSNSSSAPNTFAYIPDDGSGSYIVNAKTNTTTMFAAPPIVDPLANYAASTSTLLQFTSNGTLAYADLAQPAAGWTSLVPSFNTTLPAANATTANMTVTSTGSTGQAVNKAALKQTAAPGAAAATTGGAVNVRLPACLTLTALLAGAVLSLL